jgi:hypothetical protein
MLRFIDLGGSQYGTADEYGARGQNQTDDEDCKSANFQIVKGVQIF